MFKSSLEFRTVVLDNITYAIYFNGSKYWIEFLDGLDVNTGFSQSELKEIFNTEVDKN